LRESLKLSPPPCLGLAACPGSLGVSSLLLPWQAAVALPPRSAAPGAAAQGAEPWEHLHPCPVLRSSLGLEKQRAGVAKQGPFAALCFLCCQLLSRFYCLPVAQSMAFGRCPNP